MERNNKKYDDITSPVFQSVLNAYKATFERSHSIDARAGILLTFMITALPFYFQIIQLDNIKALLHQTVFSFIEVVQVIFFFCSIVVFLIALIFLIIVLCTRRFKIFNTEYFNNFNLIKYEDSDTTINDMNTAMIVILRDATNFNVPVVEKKTKRYKVSLWMCFSFVAAMIATILVLLF